jgi:hypothetical protein
MCWKYHYFVQERELWQYKQALYLLSRKYYYLISEEPCHVTSAMVFNYQTFSY